MQEELWERKSECRQEYAGPDCQRPRALERPGLSVVKPLLGMNENKNEKFFMVLGQSWRGDQYRGNMIIKVK